MNFMINLYGSPSQNLEGLFISSFAVVPISFSCYNRSIEMERFKMIYLDNSATTKPYPEALATYTEVASKIWGILRFRYEN